ncbi:MAG TPA: MBL fold metallo-hydrolase [Syntrophales bacterium]
MNIIIHRGTHEIGGTCVEVCSEKTRIIIDYGLPLDEAFGKKLAKRLMKGKTTAELVKEGILFDIPGLYKGQEPGVDAILISHSHKDHYGMLGFVYPDIPVYINDIALRLVQVLSVFTSDHEVVAGYRDIVHGKSFTIGDLKVTSYLVDHSAFNSMSFLVEEKGTGKRLFYSGDLRAGGWKKERFERFVAAPPSGIDCLLMEGTMAGRESTPYRDEPAVMAAVQEELEKSENNTVLAYCSGQNIDRIVSFYKAARRAKALLVIDPYTAAMLEIVQDGQSRIPRMDWDGIRVWIGNYHGHGDIYVNKIARSSLAHLVPGIGRKKIKALEIGREKALVLMRDTMIPLAERIPGIDGSTLIYSLWEGYIKDKEKEKGFWDFVNNHGLKIKHIHTSGHATIEQLQRLAGALKPKRIIPIHTQRPDMFKEYFGDRVMKVKDGQQVEI